MKKSRAIVLSSLLAAMTNAQAISVAECSELSSELNKNYPARINSFMTVTGTFCIPGTPKPTLAYRAAFDKRKSELPANTMALVNKDRQLKSWCTDPAKLEWFRQVNIRYVYYSGDGLYVGEIFHKVESCP
jgi:hypothetical protein